MVLSFEYNATKIIIDIGNENLMVFLVMSVIIIHLLVLKSIRKRTIKFANYETLKKAIGMEILHSNFLPLLLRILATISFILAIYTFNIEIIKPVSDVDFVIAMDVSQTMMGTANGEFLPNKLYVSKETAINVVDVLPENTYVGVVSFSGNAIIEQQLTRNKEEVINVLDRLNTRPPAGTAIGDAIVAGVIALGNSTKSKKAIVLITDGRQTPGLGVSINESLKYAKDNNVVINTIGIGANKSYVLNFTDINLSNLNLPPELLEQIKKEMNTTYNITELDEDALKYIANVTHGKYFYVANKTALEEAFESAVLKFNSVTIDMRKYALLFGVFLLLLEWLLGATKYKTIP